MEDIFDNAEFYKAQELDLNQKTGSLPVMEMGMLEDENFKPSFTTVETNVDTGDNSSSGQNTTVNTNAYSALVEELAGKYEIEVPKDSKFESGDDVINFFQEQIITKKIQEGIDGRLSSIGPKAKLFMDLREFIGDDEKTIAVIEDLDYYNSVPDETISSSVETQKEFIANMLALKGLTKEKIDEELTDVEALGKLDVKALEAKKFLIKAGEKFIEASKTKKEAEDKVYKDEFAKMLDSLDKVEDLSGIKVTKELQNKVKESISKPVFTDKSGKTYNDVANKQRLHKNEFEKAVNFMNALGLLTFTKEGNWTPDFSKLSVLTTNKIAKKLDAAITEDQRFSKIGGEASKGSLADVLSQL
jgi:hypothetical protein